MSELGKQASDAPRAYHTPSLFASFGGSSQPTTIGNASTEITAPGGGPFEPDEQIEDTPLLPPKVATPVSTAQTRPVYHVYERTPEGRLVPRPDDKANMAFVNARVEGNRHWILEQPQATEGLDVERARSFVSSLGLTAVPSFVTVKDPSSPFFVLFRHKTGINLGADDQEGVYYRSLGIAFALRNAQAEAQNGAGITEATLVHELVHGSSEYTAVRIEVHIDPDGNTARRQLVEARVGQCATSRADGDVKYGKFFEEGFADYVSGRYVAEALGKPHGLAEFPSPDIIATSHRDGFRLRLPSRYTIRKHDGQVIVPYEGFAGAAVEYLINKDPALLPAFIQARTDVEGLREVAGRIETIKPGLYPRLRDEYNDRERFDYGLRLVNGALNIQV